MTQPSWYRKPEKFFVDHRLYLIAGLLAVIGLSVWMIIRLAVNKKGGLVAATWLTYLLMP